METRLALIGIIVGNREGTSKLNELLHAYGKYIIGRMGVPYKGKEINVISIIIDAPQDVINALSGKLGMIDNVSTKTIYPPLPQ
ncbi:iron-only hydrogenase system regulator [Megasphaera cerevisiae DSM 20462]|jgi:putative iron-only hydrogenase system regulator|uniref:Iron-only hydrogenase system regulator n=1 Tax=Megasphaera cerevisiae DSM 20462 TaxID=1122219 RepID=A0A0J6WVU2_9FIRM|nr:TM1266 family iron-only hydrogenase system putative regulator [Megasphaera cerevisiae]KMO87630.1 iron-only hydrogenase system regulator [Megasphaera cerevisiae DSM 20462]OKY54658.1 iron-only hydrogenase system regulator [Megasphaera cerevisiae]SJZ67128.1 putative iron-only hydrogenase system regulator [Megasphaera cerevisiae DSM 20462]